MSFTKHLFQITCQAVPNTTARKFSTYCGKSEGYYGSVTAQNMRISTNALICLAEVLEHKKRNSCAQAIDQVQHVIAAEVADRMQPNQSITLAVRKLLSSAVARTALERDRLLNH